MDVGRSRYYLPGHVYFCLAGTHYVFLDLRHDKYLCLPPTYTNALAQYVVSQHSDPDCTVEFPPNYTTEPDSCALIHALLKKGLIVERKGKILAPSRIGAPLFDLSDDSGRPRPPISPAHVRNFFIAAALASKTLRWGSIERTVRSVSERKPGYRAAPTNATVRVVSDLFRVFQALRLYYPRSYLCLFDSLAFLYFLARYDVFPQWVYGVRVEPFSAHCWVQIADRVVNDIIDNVRGYTPIMSV